MNGTTSINIALLIDGDNAQPDLLPYILAEAGRYGKVTVRRIYGDWTISNMKGWKNQINKHAVRPMQQFAYTKGKNSTDSAMIIDAMDILHKKLVEGFCLVSSDSDYAGIANRIREEGVFVMGVGKANTPEAFQKACEIFIFTENLKPEAQHKEKPVRKVRVKKVTANEEVQKTVDEEPKPEKTVVHEKKTVTEIKNKITKSPLDISLINKAYEMAVQDDDLAYLSGLGIHLRRLDPSFDPRTFGYNSLTGLFKSLKSDYEFIYKANSSSPMIRKISKKAIKKSHK